MNVALEGFKWSSASVVGCQARCALCFHYNLRINAHHVTVFFSRLPAHAYMLSCVIDLNSDVILDVRLCLLLCLC